MREYDRMRINACSIGNNDGTLDSESFELMRWYWCKRVLMTRHAPYLGKTVVKVSLSIYTLLEQIRLHSGRCVRVNILECLPEQ
jgi:hypothetical protein